MKLIPGKLYKVCLSFASTNNSINKPIIITQDAILMFIKETESFNFYDSSCYETRYEFLYKKEIIFIGFEAFTTTLKLIEPLELTSP